MGKRKGVHTLEFSEIDNGDPNSAERKRVEKYIKSFWRIGISIDTSISICNFFSSSAANNLFIISPMFSQNTYYNAFSMAIIQLADYFSEDTASFNGFFEYCDQHKQVVFNKHFFEETIGVKNSKTEVNMGTFAERLEKAKKLIEENQELINNLKYDRDKFYAHFDKKRILQNKKRMITNVEQLKNGLDLVERILNTIGGLYDRSYRSFQSIGRSDINEIGHCVDLYVNNKLEIINLKHNGELQ